MPRTAYVTPEVLKWAREQAGYSYDEAAKSYVNPQKLKRVEQGKEHLTFKQLVKLARRYRRPIPFFYRDHPPDEELIQDFRTKQLQEPTFTPRLREQIMEIKEKREIAVKFQYYDQEYDYSYIRSISLAQEPGDVAEKIRSILNLPLQARNEWNNAYDALNAWKDTIESIGVLVFQLRRVPTTYMRGFSLSKTPYPVIGINSKDAPLGRVFSLIHEFCHLMLDKGGICNTTWEKTELFDIEAFCNAVAGHVLVPKKKLLESEIVKKHPKHQKEWSKKELNSLQKTFWASKEVILRRLLIYEQTSNKFYQEKRDSWREKATPTPGGPEKPHAKVLHTHPESFLKILLNAMYEEQITMADVSKYLGMSLKHLPDLEKALR